MQKQFLCMRATALSALTLVLVFTVSVSQATAGARVHVESVIAAPGDVVGVGVYLGGSTIDIAGFNIPLRYNSADVTPDSVSVIGSILDPSMAAIKSMKTDSGYFGVLVLPPFSAPIPTISVDSGLLCTFWFTVSPSAGPQDIVLDSLNTVDTVNVEPLIVALRRIEFVDPTGLITTLPTFSVGHIQLLVTDIEDDFADATLPKKFELAQNYPNPFNPSTKIGFTLPERSTVKLDVFNLLGQRVTTLFEGELGIGAHEFEWDASSSPSGVYFYRLKSGLGSYTKKMMLMK